MHQNVFSFTYKKLSWYYQVNFQLQNEEGDTGTFIANGEWALLGT